MGKCVIKCAKCGTDWRESDGDNSNACVKCGALYCAKNRKYEWVEDNKESEAE
jgi:ribosomal protein L37E